MAIASYDVGDRIRLGNHSSNTATGAISDVNGDPVDPTDITMRVEEPDGTAVTYSFNGVPSLSKENVGRYYVDVTLDAAGLWKYRLAWTGAAIGAEEGVLHVRKGQTG